MKEKWKAITFKLIEQVIREFKKYNSAIGYYSVLFIIRILSSAFYQPHFSIRVLWSSFFHPPPSGPHFTETRVLCRMLWRLGNTGVYWVLDWIRIPDKQIRFEYATCGRRIREEKVANSKISEYVWTRTWHFLIIQKTWGKVFVKLLDTVEASATITWLMLSFGSGFCTELSSY